MLTTFKNTHAAITFICLTISCLIHGQTYYKIPIDTNYYWRQFSICLDNNSQVKRLDYQIRYFKDTVISGKIYNKYSRFGRYGGDPGCSSFISNGYLRQDTLNKLVFILDHNFVERPLYNFSKKLGDTLLSYNNVLLSNQVLTVQSVATATLFDGSLRKALWTSDHNCHIEGAGSIFGGLYGHTQLFVHNVSEQLICFGRIEPFFELMEGITTQKYSCLFVPETVGLEKHTLTDQIKLYPIPSKDFIELSFSDEALLNDFNTITISNNLGQKLREGIITNERFRINIEDLPPGSYSLYIKNQEGTGLNKRFVVAP